MPSFVTRTLQRLYKSLYENDINQISTSWVSTTFEIPSNVKQFHDRLSKTIITKEVKMKISSRILLITDHDEISIFQTK